LQWATYRDASDQCSLSRIWGGIHPPVDDIPGRELGIILGNKVIENANYYFNGESADEFSNFDNPTIIYPNPVQRGKIINLETNGFFEDLFIINALQQVVYSKKINSFNVEISTNGIMPGMYFVIIKNQKNMAIKKLIIN